MKNRFTLFLASAMALLSAFSASAQPDSLSYSVGGRVRDSRSGLPVQYVDVTMNGRRHSTVTNADGSFVLKSDIPIRQLNFSHLGYSSVSVPVTSASLNVSLSPASYQLDPAMVLSANPRMLVNEAIARIPTNYASSEELLECFYRETMQKRQRYIYVSEAVSRLYKTSYGRGVYRDAAALEKSRVLISSRKRDTLSVKFLGGPAQAIDFDVVKNPDVLLNREELFRYRFEMGTPEEIDGRLNFTVLISPGMEVPYALYYGVLYIDMETYAFSRIELSLDMSDESKATRDMLVRKPSGLRFHPKEMTITIDYRKDGEVWRLGFFRSLLDFSCDWRKRLLHTTYTSVNELVVTGLNPNPAPIPRQAQFHVREALSEKAGLFTDPDFWKDYNIIEPSVSLEHAVERLLIRK